MLISFLKPQVTVADKSVGENLYIYFRTNIQAINSQLWLYCTIQTCWENFLYEY